MVALVFATNLMAQQISCVKSDWFEQVACDKYGDIYVNNNSGLKSLKNNITLTGRWAIKLDFKKNLIALNNGDFIRISNKKVENILIGDACFTDKPSRNTFFDILSNDDIIYTSLTLLTTDPQGGLVCGPLKRFSDFKIFGIELKNVLSDAGGGSSYFLRNICADNKGNVWILGNKGLAKFDGSNFTYYNIGNTPNFPGLTTSMQCDTLGNVWIGSNTGLVKFDGSNWSNYNISNSGLISNDVLNIALSNDYNSIWVGTTDGFSLFNGKEWKNFNNKIDEQIPLKLGDLSMSEDTNGNLWFSSGGKGYILCKKINQTILSTNITKELVCDNEIIIQTPFKGSIYSWSTGDTTSNLKVKTPGEYNVLIFDSLGCPYSKSITINSTDLKLEQPSICMVTTENSATKLIWSQTTSNIFSKYNIYRQSSENSNYEKIHEQKLDVLSEYIDNGTNPNIKTYRYKISYVDTCGNETPLSDNHATILLSSNVGINGTVNLFWNPYEGFTYPNFEIWRSTDGVNFIKIGAVANNSYAYIDNNPPSIAWYQIRITKQDACLATKRGENYVGSNIISKEGKSLYINEQKNESITIYPNPTKDVITIKNAQGNTLRIVDVQGKEVYNALVTNVKTEISMKTFGKAGVYILHVVDANNVSIETKQIVLE